MLDILSTFIGLILYRVEWNLLLHLTYSSNTAPFYFYLFHACSVSCWLFKKEADLLLFSDSSSFGTEGKATESKSFDRLLIIAENRRFGRWILTAFMVLLQVFIYFILLFDSGESLKRLLRLSLPNEFL